MKVAFAVSLGLCAGIAIGACVKNKSGALDQQRIDRKNEITALWTQIRDWRREAGLEVEPTSRSLTEVRSLPFSRVRRERLCPEAPPPPACEDVCSLADAICDNAESICGIAAELAPDEWAAEKCTSAKASCREAKQRCCSCDDHK